MHVSDRQHTDFIVFIPEKSTIRRYKRDTRYIEDFMIPMLECLYFTKFLPLRIAQLRGLLESQSVELPHNMEVEPVTQRYLRWLKEKILENMKKETPEE